MRRCNSRSVADCRRQQRRTAWWRSTQLRPSKRFMHKLNGASNAVRTQQQQTAWRPTAMHQQQLEFDRSMTWSSAIAELALGLGDRLAVDCQVNFWQPCTRRRGCVRVSERVASGKWQFYIQALLQYAPKCLVLLLPLLLLSLGGIQPRSAHPTFKRFVSAHVATTQLANWA